jgi:hypothetical protein
MHHTKRKPHEIRRVKALGKEYRDAAYRPKFAVALMCEDEADQRSVYDRIAATFPNRETKVLVV